MLFALVHAGHNVHLELLAADFRSQNAGAGLIWMESKEQAAQLKVLLEKEPRNALECKYKVVSGPRPAHGSVRQFLCGCGEEWPALFCGRASDTEEMTVRGRFKTPLGETLYIGEINFLREVAGSFQCARWQCCTEIWLGKSQTCRNCHGRNWQKFAVAIPCGLSVAI